MKPSQITQIIIRFFSIVWALGGIMALGQGMDLMRTSRTPQLPVYTALYPGLSILLCVLLLWIFASPLAKLICKGIDETVSLHEVTFYQLLVVMFVGLGTYFCLRSVGGTFQWIYAIFIDHIPTESYFDNARSLLSFLRKDVITFIAGIVVILLSHKWALRISKRG